MKARQTVSFHLQSHLSCLKWQLGATQSETLETDRVELNTSVHNLQSVYLFTFSSQLSLYITSFWGSTGNIHHRSCTFVSKHNQGARDTGIAEITKGLRQTSGICIDVIFFFFFFSCIHSSVLMTWCIFCSILLFVLVVNHWSIHHIQPFIYYLLPGQKCLLNKMHFCYPKPSDQASRHVVYVSFAVRCIF